MASRAAAERYEEGSRVASFGFCIIIFDACKLASRSVGFFLGLEMELVNTSMFESSVISDIELMDDVGEVTPLRSGSVPGSEGNTIGDVPRSVRFRSCDALGCIFDDIFLSLTVGLIVPRSSNGLYLG